MKLQLVTGPEGLAPLSGEFMRPSVALPEVDWTREAVLVLDMGEQRTGGYRIAVTGVARTPAGEVEVSLEVQKPAPGSFVAQVITHPYAVARVPREWLTGAPIVGRDQHGHELIRQVVSL
ncbi:MAG TPA: protease complex subunit PrcB family protein [Symbiobacteriaceae bacterium]|nr:protease complex subunit PrcB family protein [Symbiobacteriaceae bacterium]